MPEEALGDPGLVEVLRDPAEEERPAGAEEEAVVDIRRFLDDAFFEQPVDLVGDGLEHGLDDLLARPRRVLDHDDLVVSLGVVGQRRREREPVGEGLMHPFEDVVRDPRAHHLQQDGRRHRHPQ